MLQILVRSCSNINDVTDDPRSDSSCKAVSQYGPSPPYPCRIHQFKKTMQRERESETLPAVSFGQTIDNGRETELEM